MIVDALILAGGRSSRLGDSDKRELVLADGRSLLRRSIEAVRSLGSRSVVLVGEGRMDAVVTVREDPPFAGPVAAIAAGSAALPMDSDLVLVLACDMPGISAALPAMFAPPPSGDGAIAVDRGMRQQLVFTARPASLARALAELPVHADAPVRALLAGLDLREVAVPDGSTDDIDTWDDAERFGAVRPSPTGART